MNIYSYIIQITLYTYIQIYGQGQEYIYVYNRLVSKLNTDNYAVHA